MPRFNRITFCQNIDIKFIYFCQKNTKILSAGVSARVVSRAGFGSGSGLKLTKISDLILASDILFVLSAQKYNQNNLATLLNFSDLT